MKHSKALARNLAGATATALLALAPLAARADITLSNTPDGITVGVMGYPGDNIQTFGEVFTAPVTGNLTSFTFDTLAASGDNTGAGNLFTGVGLWNGPATPGTGYGVQTLLFETPSQASTSNGYITTDTNIFVHAGQQYVAFISTYNEPNVNPTDFFATAQSVPGIDYEVYDYAEDPGTSSSWGYPGVDPFNLEFSATFERVCNADIPCTGGVPEPASWALMILGFGAAGAGLRRRRRAPLAA